MEISSNGFVRSALPRSLLACRLPIGRAPPLGIWASRWIGGAGAGFAGKSWRRFLVFLSKHQYQLPLRTWQYENISSLYGVCASYPALAHRVASEQHEIAGNLNGANWAVERISRLAASKSSCQVCQVGIDAEQQAAGEAADRVCNIFGINLSGRAAAQSESGYSAKLSNHVFQASRQR